MRYGTAALYATLFAIATWACTDAPPDSLGSPRPSVPFEEETEESTTEPRTKDDEDDDETEPTDPPEVEEENADAGKDDEAPGTAANCKGGTAEAEPNDDPNDASAMGLVTCGVISPGDVDQFVLQGKKKQVITFQLVSETKVKLQVNVVGGQTANGSGTRITGKTQPGNRKVIFRVSGATSEGQYRIFLKKK